MRLREFVLSAVFAASIAAASYVALPIPSSPVPVTLQVYAVLLVAAVLSPKASAACLGIYLLLGGAGLPIFSQGRGGIGVILGPTGGYLIGFLAAAPVVSMLARRYGDSVIKLSAAMCAGVAIIYTTGVAQLALVMNLGLARALMVGVLPFIPFDLAKALAAGVTAHRVRRILKGRHLR